MLSFLYVVLYSIEFQNRGLPHAHILIWLHHDNKYPSPADIDRVISAEIPDKDSNPDAYEAVAQFMVHGPCGRANKNSSCMVNGSCTKKFPKNFYNETTIDDNGYPIYRRRDDGRFIQKGDVKLDNSYVVPHNINLLVKYQAHINVEWCNQSKAIKYLFKYINKGPDRATMLVQENVRRNEISGKKQISDVDEIKSYLDCRYISACEACWRIYQFDIHYRTPAVERLSFHLQDEHTVTFTDNQRARNVINRYDIGRAMIAQLLYYI